MCIVNKYVKLSLIIIVIYNVYIIFSFFIRCLYYFFFDDIYICFERKK